MTSELEKCCLEYKSRGTTFRHHGGYYTANKNIMLIVQTVNYNVSFHPLRESKMCQYVHVIGSVRTPRYLIICRRSVNLFPVYVCQK
jgi:hypothetical protein